MLGHIIQLWDHLNYADGAYEHLIQLSAKSVHTHSEGLAETHYHFNEWGQIRFSRKWVHGIAVLLCSTHCFQWRVNHKVFNRSPAFCGGPRLASAFFMVLTYPVGWKWRCVNNPPSLWVGGGFISPWIFNPLLNAAPHLEAVCKSHPIKLLTK